MGVKIPILRALVWRVIMDLPLVPAYQKLANTVAWNV